MILLLKIGGEVLILLVLISLSNAFWSLCRLPSLYEIAFSNHELLVRAVLRNRRGEFYKSKVIEMGKMNPVLSSIHDSIGYVMLLGSYVEAAIKTWRTVRNFQLVIIMVLIALSWFLSPYVAIGNLIVFLAFGRLINTSSDAIAEVLGSIQLTAFIVEKWYERFPSECKNFCFNEGLRFKALYIAVSESQFSSAS